MFRKITSLIVLFTFTNYLAGCYRNELITPNLFALTSDTITQLVLKDGNIVKFDYTGGGGKYSVREAAIKVMHSSGDTSFVPLSELKYVYPGKALITSPGTLAGRRVVEAFYHDTKVAFDINGGWLDSNRQAIEGIDLAGNKLRFPPLEAMEIYTVDANPVSKEDFLRDSSQPVGEIMTTSGRITDVSGLEIVSERKVVSGITDTGQTLEVPADNILGAEIRRMDTGMTVVAVFIGIPVIIGGIFLIALLVNPPKSCPFVYSYDGSQYHFDAEPLGGAICSGLQRTDVSCLESLKSVDDKYNLLVRNELDETQHLDELKLLVVDHPAGETVLPDGAGNLISVQNIRNATSVVDDNGTDLMKFFKESDGAVWQTDMPTVSTMSHTSLRHNLTITLHKPKGAKEARVVHNIGTATWGATMLTKMLELHGKKVDEWLGSIQPGTDSYKELYRFLEREESYYLKLMVKKGDTWVHRGTIRGQGPFKTEVRVTTIDVSDLRGDSLVVRLSPPMGFWTIDYLGVSYDNPAKPHITELAPISVEANTDVSILSFINGVDDKYYSMHNVGDWAKLSFACPPTATDGASRTVFLKTTGYYEQHLDKSRPEQTALLKQIIDTPGYITEVAMEEFIKWQLSQLAQQK